jgi:nucleotide-binding universal stress UspA family protein
MPYRSIVVGTDGSETANLAVRHAAELAKAFGSKLTVITAFTPTGADAVARAQQEVPADLQWMLTDSAQADDRAQHGASVAREVGVKEVRIRVGGGDPANVLLEIADEISADLIVVGSRGMTSTSRFLLGSVPNKISHHAPCDLVIVRTVD